MEQECFRLDFVNIITKRKRWGKTGIKINSTAHLRGHSSISVPNPAQVWPKDGPPSILDSSREISTVTQSQ
jgi:hypothetical protein